MDQICRNSTHSFKGKVICLASYRPGKHFSYECPILQQLKLLYSRFLRFVYERLHLRMENQLFGGIAQPVFQVLGPMYSERWFDLKGRTTATMIIAVGMHRMHLVLLSYMADAI